MVRFGKLLNSATSHFVKNISLSDILSTINLEAGTLQRPTLCTIFRCHLLGAYDIVDDILRSSEFFVVYCQL